MKILLTSLVVGGLVTAVVAGQAVAPRPTLPVAYVSGQRIFAESGEGKALRAKLQTQQQQRANDLRTRQQTLEGVRKQLAQATDNTARVQLQQQELQQRTDLERATVQAQTDIQNLQRQVQVEFQGRVRDVLAELVKGQNVQVVLNGDAAVVWSVPGMDLTNAVIERLNGQATAAPAKR
ncbi:MAG: OmpH family outer membrane protein [Acidobacteria bacterium]|nr:OmpH family outer membrane protein [Acidobacteriota bacterium]